MSEDWSAVASEIYDGLTEAGQTGYVVKAATVSGEPWENPQGAKTWHPVKIVHSRWTAKEIEGTIINMSDRKVLVSATSITPEQGDEYSDVDGAAGSAIVEVRRIQPAGQSVLYILAVRD